jgi:RES domain-containing protein
VLSGASLDKAIQQLISRPFRHTFFRAMPLRYARDPLGKRRPIVSQRFNLTGGARMLYLAEDQVTCLHEIQAFGWPASAIVIVPVQFDLKAVVDLRDHKLLTLLQTNSAEIAMNFRSITPGPAPTQMLGERCAN